MAHGDSALTGLKKASNKLREVQRNLAEAQFGALPEHVDPEKVERARGLVTQLVEECVGLKTNVIGLYEALGGEWPEPACKATRQVSDRTLTCVFLRHGGDVQHYGGDGYYWL